MEKTADKEKAHFTYLWVLENVSNWHLSRAYRSLVFTIDSMENTKWQLTMDLATIFITFYIQRADEDDGPDSIEIDYEIALLGADGWPVVKKMSRKQFEKSSYYTLRGFEKTEDVFYTRKDTFLPNGNLTVQCKMWRTGTRMPKTALCFVRTRKSVDRVSFVWKIKDFSTLRPKEKRIHFINPPTKEAPRLILTFYLCEKMGKEFAFIEIDRSIDTKCHAIYGKISLLDANGRSVKYSKMEECVSESNETICLIKMCFKKSDFLSDKESLLPNDVLSLRCEFSIDVEPVWNQIESYKDFESTLPEVSEIHFDDERVETCMTSCSLRNFFRSCYEDGILSDVCLQAGSETFPVHRAMLSIRSPVFKTMFMKKKQKAGECVEIPGIGEDTFRHLLSYIYNDIVPELKWSEVVDLYKVSDEYELLDLREICSNFLKVNISSNNFCSVLLLADKYKDQCLQSVANNYVFIHSDEIFDSDGWKKFKVSEPRLSMETTESIICSMQNEEPYYVLPEEIDKYDNYYSQKFNDSEENRISDHKPLERTYSGEYLSLF
ncbi:TD and POZ domain-containing protein 4 [Araneus ventricosus]|uniref:TD and POZ domain-containing protein 4 n=1 Tax=Araneus ventricosus TaxID=182803 RepID=A0A4Y2HQL6_ARAVE|nr:TD and POZ domain-containing protein 4 [Araneus ventricosus]